MSCSARRGTGLTRQRQHRRISRVDEVPESPESTAHRGETEKRRTKGGFTGVVSPRLRASVVSRFLRNRRLLRMELPALESEHSIACRCQSRVVCGDN